MKFGYIIACWVGERRTATPAYSKDKLIYIKQQIKCLQKFRHSLDLVVFVFNQPDEPEDTAANHRQLIESAKNLLIHEDILQKVNSFCKDFIKVFTSSGISSICIKVLFISLTTFLHIPKCSGCIKSMSSPISSFTRVAPVNKHKS